MYQCIDCGNDVAEARYQLGYKTCLVCGEKHALQYKHTIVPMPKSNYIVVTDLELLKGLNSSHKSR
jgi:DNA-directed RNA polymerase subunit RPC12/RpoP